MSDHEDDVEPVLNRLDAVSVVIIALSAAGLLFLACYVIILLVTL